MIALAGCGGAGYGEPIAGTDAATVALAPAPVTTPGVTTIETRTTDAAGSGSTSSSSGGSSSGATSTDGGSSGDGSDGSGGGSGSSSGGGSDAGNTVAAYAADVNRFCTGFNTATKALTSEISAAGASNPKALGRAIVRYGSAIDDAADGLRAAPPPSSFSSFHQRTLSWVSGVTSAISANRSGLNSGDQSAGASVIGKVQGLGKPPTAPSDLRARATACTA